MKTDSLRNWLVGLAMHARITGSEAFGGDPVVARAQAKTRARLAVIDAQETLAAIEAITEPDAAKIVEQRDGYQAACKLIENGIVDGRVHVSPEIKEAFRVMLASCE